MIKRKVIFATLLLSLLLPMTLSAQDSLQVCNGTSTNSYIPIHGFYNDSRFRNEFIYPARLLNAMAGSTITGLTFYADDDESWTSNLELRIAEVSDTTFDSSMPWKMPASTQAAWTGTCSVVNGRWEISLTDPYTYSGGNLLISVMNTAAGSGCPYSHFYGAIQSHAAAGNIYGTSTSSATGPSYTQAFLPKVTFTYTSSSDICLTPSNLTASNITPSDATISWNSRNGESSWALYLNGSFGNEVYDSTYVFTNLNANTAYTVRVRAICGIDDTSNSSTVSFRTACGSISALPWNENFNSYTGTSASSNTSSITNLPCWDVIGNYNDYTFLQNSWNHDSDASGNALRIYGHTTSYPTFIILPTFTETLSSLSLGLWMTTDNSNTYLGVGYMTDATDTSTYTEVSTLVPRATGNWELFETPMSPNASGRMVIRYYGNYGNIRVDDISVFESPSCGRPSYITMRNIGSDQAELFIFDTVGTAANYTVKLYNDTLLVDSMEVQDTVVTFTSLTPNTDYTVSMAANCSDGSAYNPLTVQFRTACVAIANSSLPFVEGFESYNAGSSASSSTAMNLSCWAVTNRYSQNYPYFSTSQHHSGNNSMAIYTSNTTPTVVALPLFEDSPSSLMLNFWLYGQPIQVGVMSNPNDPNTFVAVQNCAPATTNSWNMYDVTFDGITSDYIAFRYNGSGYGTAYIDDITVLTTPSCARPTDIVMQNITDQEAELHIIDTIGDAISYTVKVYNDSAMVDSIEAFSTVVPFYSLTPNTLYTVSMTANCSDGGSTSTLTLQFQTACTAFPTDSLPFFEGFEGYAGSSYSSTSSAMNIPCWSVLDRYSSNYPYFSTSQSHTGSNSLAIYSYSSPATIVSLPHFEETPNNLMLDFWLYGQPVQVGIISNPMDANSFVAVQTITPASSSAWEHCQTTFANQYSGLIAIRYAGGSTSYSYIDDITVSALPSCTSPSSVVASNISTTSADIIINDANGINHYMIYLSATDSVEWYDTIYQMTDLTPSTAYTVSVRTICNDYTMTDPTSVSFRTGCDIISTLPWHEDFNSYSSLFTSYPNEMVGEMIPCWGLIKSNPGAHMSLSGSNYRYGDSGYSLVFYPGVANRSTYIVLPEFSDDISGLELQFQTRPEGTSSNSGSFDVGYLTSATDTTTFVSVQHYDYSDFNNEYQQKLVSFVNAPTGSRMAMRHNSASSNWYWFVDEVDVHALPSCEMPTSIAVSDVTTTSITVSVSGNEGNSYDYRIFHNDTIVDSASSTDTSWTFNYLMPNRPYTIEVRTECYDGGYTSALTVQTRTACAVLTVNDLPYTEDFESFAASLNDIPCWTRHNFGTSYTSYPQIYSTTGFWGTSSKVVYFNTNQTIEYLVLPEVESLSNLQFSYFAKTAGSYTADVKIGVMTDPTDTATFSVLETVSVNNSWNYYTTDLSQYSDTGRFVAIRFYADQYRGFYLDDVELRVAPSCARPASISLSNVTTTSAQLHINGAQTTGNYTIALAYGTIVDTLIATDTLVNLTGLSANTNYTVAVVANCADGFSHFPLIAQFSTPCDAIDSLPWNEGFENMATDLTNNLPCWSYIANSNSNSKVIVVSTSSRVHSGSKALRFNGNCQTPNFSVLPYFEDSIQSLRLSMWIVAENSTNPGLLRVGYLTNPTDSSSFVQTASFNCADYTTYQQVEVYFAGAPAGSRIAISQLNNANYWWWVDDLEVDYAPVCSSPVIAVSNITDTSATVTLTDANNTNHYRLFTSPTDSIEVTGNTITLTGLTYNTTYALTAVTICSGNEVSNSSSATFTTACSLITTAMLPWSEGFEGYTGSTYSSATSAFNDPCWTILNRYSNNYPYINTNASYPNSGSQCLTFYSSSSAATILALPPFADSLANLLFTFSMMKTSSSAAGVEVGYLTDPTNASSFVSLQSCTNTSSSTYQTFETRFPNNATGLIALRYNGSYTSLYLDDFSVLIAPNCHRPGAVTVSNITAYSADITITDTTNNNNYRIVVNGTDTTDITSQTLSLTGLTPATNYTVSVSSLCPDGNVTAPINVAFQTLCASITTLPWTEDFSSIPAGTSNIYTNGYLPCWDMFRGRYIDSTNTVTSEPVTSDIFALNSNAMGSTHLRCNIYGNNNYRWLATPSFTLSTPAEFSFRYALTKYDNADPIDSIGSDDRFMVLVTANGGTTWTPVYTFGHGADADVQIDSVSNIPDSVAIDLTSFMGQTIRIAFYGESVLVNTDNDFHIDDLRLISTGLPPTYYDVTLLSSDSTMGSVSPAGTTSIVENSSFTATATANDGYHFVGWSDGIAQVSTDNPYTFIVNNDITLTAVFEQDIVYYTVNISSSDNNLGHPSPSGDTLVAEGQSITVSASTHGIARFDGWYIGEERVSTDNPYTFQVNSDMAIVANFVQCYTLQLDYNPFQGQATGNGIYDAGSEVTITATPEAGYLFNGWLFSGSTDTIFTNPYTFTINENTEIEVLFKQQPVGIDDVVTADFTLFPNPASNVVSLSGIENGATVTILDINGRQTFHTTANNDNVTIDLQGYAQGTYFVRVTGKQGTAVRKLIVK